MYFKKIKLIIVLSFLFNFSTQAQTGLFKSKLSNPLLEEAIEESIVVIQEDYHLEDEKGEQFFRGTKPYYNRVYGVGIKANGSIWTGNIVNEDWLNNQNNTNKENYNIKVSKTHFKGLKDVSFQKGSILKNRKIKSEDLVSYKTRTKENNLKISSLNESNNWVTIFYSDSPLIEKPEASIKSITFPVNPRKNGNSFFVEALPVKGMLLGGFLLHANIQTGQINFSVTGVLNQVQNSNKWEVQFLEKNSRAKEISKKEVPKELEETTSKGGKLQLQIVTKKGKLNKYNGEKLQISISETESRSYKIDEEGIVNIDSYGLGLLKINGKGAVCINEEETFYTIKCKKKRGRVIPINKVKSCK